MGTETKVLVPDIGDFSGVEIIEVMVSPGDSVAVEDSLITLESDKATMEIPSPCAGTVKSVALKVGDKVSEGDLLLVMDVEEAAAGEEVSEDVGGSAPPSPAAEEAEAVQAPAPAATRPERRPGDKQPTHPPVLVRPSDAPAPKAHASPSVRQFARELGVDLVMVKGSGRKGRVTREDVQAFIKQALRTGVEAPPATGFRLPSLPDVDFTRFGETETRPLSRIKRVSGSHLAACWLNIPHVTQFDEADITDLEAFRRGQREAGEQAGVRVTLLPFVMKACVATLKAMPEFNSSLTADGEALVYKHYYNIGVAVDTPSGLVVPVVRDVDRKGVLELSRDLAELSGRAREGKLLPADMQGGTFSISSLGGIGGTAFTPIVNAPEVAILGVSRSETKPVWNGEAFVPRLRLPLSLSYDHRVIDGAQAARFARQLSETLGEIRRLLM